MKKLFGLILHDPFADLAPGTRRWVRRLFWTLAGLMIFALSLSALFALALEQAPGYRQRLERFAGDVVQRPLRIGDLALRWHGGAPSLELSQVEVLAPDGVRAMLSIEAVHLGFGPWRLLTGNFDPAYLGFEGLELVAGRSPDGEWRIAGLEALFADDSTADLDSLLRALARFDAFSFERCTLELHDARVSPQALRLGVERLRLSQGLRGPQLEVRVALPPEVGRRMDARARLRGRLAERQSWSGDWSVEIKDLRSLPWLRLLGSSGADVRIEGGQLRVNGQLQDGQPQWADVALNADTLQGGRTAPHARVQGLRLESRLSAQPFGWRADIRTLQLAGERGVWPLVTGQVTWTPATVDNGAHWSSQLSFARLDDLAPWLGVAASELLARLPVLQGISGDLRGFDASFRSDIGTDVPRYTARANFERLSVPVGAHGVGVSGLSGEVSLDESGGRLALRDAAFDLRLPKVFATPLPVEKLSTELRWRREAAGWNLSTPQFSFALAGSQGRGDFSLALAPGASPVLKLKTQFKVADAARLKPFMPSHWGPDLRQWLMRGLIRTPIKQAQLVIDGPLADFPFVRKPGLWSLDAEVSDAEVDYARGWPVIKGLDAQLAFRGNGLAISASRGAIRGMPLQKVEARFRDFDDGQLSIDGLLAGELRDLYGVMEASPIRSRFEGLLKRTRASGPSRVALRLQIPLHHTDATQVSGRVAVDGADVLLTDINEPVRGLRGEISFDAIGINARKLEGQLLGQPLTASILARRGASVLTAFWVLDLAGTSPLSAKLPAGLRERLSGSAALRAQLRLSGPEAAALVLDSDLRGAQLRLPAPLAKTAATAAPLRVVISENPKSGPQLVADWSGRLGADLRWRVQGARSELNAVTLRLGREAPVFADVLPGLSLAAVASELSIDDWADLLEDLGDARGRLDALPLVRANLRALRWLWRGFALAQTQVRAEPEGQGWLLRFDGVGAQGAATWTRERVQARLTQLLMERDANAAPRRPSTAVLDPARWPQLDVEIGRFEIAEAVFGMTRVRTQKVPGGQKLLTLSTQGGENELTASGLWLRRDGRSSANLSARLNSSDFEGLQRAFGFGATLAAKTSRISLQSAWSPSAGGVAWQQARGDLALEFDDGALRGIEPGVSRVLGLFNFYALPRRLTLNFGDVADKGLAFDTIRGSFSLADGQARTDDIEVKGPSLRIKMKGRAGLVARDYQQNVTVYPGLSTGFTLGAALLAGPIGAGLVFLAQQILDQPLEKLTQINYCVTGSWDDPQVSGECP